MKTSSKIAIAAAAVGAWLIARKNKSVSGIDGSQSRKRQQLQLILANNAAEDDIHTWVRSEDDIHTFEELVSDLLLAGEDLTAAPDFTDKDIRKALNERKVKVYSSHPIFPGVFVTPSRMEAESYAGGGRIYERSLRLRDIAWIDLIEGMYAPVSDVSRVFIRNEFSI